jgi:diketogulonate reductase-like aldo/keto reductase
MPSMTVPTAKLVNGYEIPRLGLGMWQLNDGEECESAVRFALAAGYRHFDSAQDYGNEGSLGNAIRESGIDRESLFLTTKIWNDNLGFDSVIPSFEDSLERLQTDYVDLLLVHFPVTERRRPAWRRIEDIYRSGRARAIGVSNYTIRHLEELLEEGDVKPAVDQVELHVFLQQRPLVEYCREHEILVEAYSPLAHGYRMSDPTLGRLAEKHGKTPAQIMIRWCLETGLVPLPKSVRRERIESNLDVFDFSLSAEDLDELAGLDSGIRTCWDPTHVP